LEDRSIGAVKMRFRELFKADVRANQNNFKGLLVVITFRFAHCFAGWRKSWPLLWFVSLPYLVLYRLCVEWILGIELPQKTQVGPGLIIWHGQGLVVNDGAVLGANVQLRHNVTIGNREYYGPCPVIEDNVDIGAGSFILGPITLGKGAKIGAGAVVLQDVPPGAVAVGNPARIIIPNKGDERAPEGNVNI
jgi:serine acetyltransferase